VNWTGWDVSWTGWDVNECGCGVGEGDWDVSKAGRGVGEGGRGVGEGGRGVGEGGRDVGERGRVVEGACCGVNVPGYGVKGAGGRTERPAGACGIGAADMEAGVWNPGGVPVYGAPQGAGIVVQPGGELE
jgi:hypothetical protein